MEFNLSNLAAGGLIAALVGFWSQFKSFARYLSSFMVLQVELDSYMSVQLSNYLKVHFKRAPSGLFRYATDYLFIRRLRKAEWVPFRTLNSVTVFYSGACILVLSISSNDTLKVFGLRGFVDVEELLANSLRYTSTVREQLERNVDRFFIRKVLGSEKGIWGQSNMGNAKLAEATPNVSDRNSCLLAPSPNYDVSFMYSHEEYRSVESDDPFSGLFYEAYIYEHVEQAKKWLNSREWYQSRSIPWRRGWMLYGPGGTGKSSLSLALARTLNVPIYQYQLATLSDREFIEEWSGMTTPCIALLEDFDTVFDKRTPLTEHKALTFDCVLNQISGVASVDGVFLIVTTNKLDKIDEALGNITRDGQSTRPGRIDRVIHIGPTSEETRRKIANHILRDWPEVHEKLVKDGHGLTPVQFQEICIQHAYKNYM